MVWYPLDWCYRMGVSDIFLITPPESKPALEAAMLQNPHLTSLPFPRPTIIAPTTLTNTSGTGEIFRTAEVKEAVRQDFIVLPCDIVSELDGPALLQEWMVDQAGFGGAAGGLEEGTDRLRPPGIGGEQSGRRGALGMWYDTKGDYAIKNEETDFIATVPFANQITPVPRSLIRNRVARLATAMPTDSLNDILEEKKSLETRQVLSRTFGNVRIRTSVRDSHVYLFPFWTLEFMQNEVFESIGEDVLGLWAKASWQDGLADKLGLKNILDPKSKSSRESRGDSDEAEEAIADESEINAADYSSSFSQKQPTVEDETATQFFVERKIPIPPILAYIHASSSPSTPLVRRVDSVPALLATSLQIARLPASNSLDKETVSSPLAHPLKIAHPDNLPRATRVEADNCLLAENVTIGAKCNIKESVIGAGCSIGTGVRLTKCLLMENVILGDNVSLSNCVLGRRCKLEGGLPKSEEKTSLDTCEVQSGFIVPWGTEAKGEKFMLFEGLDDTIKTDEDDMKAEDTNNADETSS